LCCDRRDVRVDTKTHNASSLGKKFVSSGYPIPPPCGIEKHSARSFKLFKNYIPFVVEEHIGEKKHFFRTFHKLFNLFLNKIVLI
jgi:hypothetical protein